MKYNIQVDIGNHLLEHAIQQLTEGQNFVIVLDNIDWSESSQHGIQAEYNYSCSYQKYSL